MIEPYETVFRNALQEFSNLGFSLVRDSEYGATFSNGTYSIEVSLDRYYHPGLAMAIRDSAGKQFEVGLLQQILDPVHFASEMAAPKTIRERFGLDQADMPREARLQGVLEYLQVMLTHILQFLAEYKERVFCSPNEYETDYAVKANARVSQLLKRRQ